MPTYKLMCSLASSKPASQAAVHNNLLHGNHIQKQQQHCKAKHSPLEALIFDTVRSGAHAWTGYGQRAASRSPEVLQLL